MRENTSSELTTASQAARGKTAMVATALPAATQAALEMLQAGGNAVDAAVAAAWALSVCEPSGSGLGGQTTLMIYLPGGQIIILDGHSYAPSGVSCKTVSELQQQWGYRACTIPSTPATLGAALQRYGKLLLSQVMEPAVALAEQGFAVTRILRRHIRWCQAPLSSSAFAAGIFLPTGKAPLRGSILRQPALAKTLRRLASAGTDDYYHGEIAQTIAEDMRRHGGLLNLNDLRECNLPVEREPLSISYRGYRIVSVPPPGGGIQLLLGLKILERLEDHHGNGNIPAWAESLALVINAAFRERERWPLPPDQLTPSLRQWLLGDERAAEITAAIRSKNNLVPLEDAEEEEGETTHVCVVDSAGMAVALTQSIQSLFGAKVAGKKLGFFYNNYLCTCPRYPHPFQLRSGAMPQSNVAPTFVLRENNDDSAHPLRLMLGAAGSRRITSSVLQIIANCLNRGMSLPESVGAPRIHTMLSSKVLLERDLASATLESRLSKYFRRIEVKAARSHSMGAVQAIARDENGGWIGAADPRRDGAAGGF